MQRMASPPGLGQVGRIQDVLEEVAGLVETASNEACKQATAAPERTMHHAPCV
jgi:hypothetical protein